MCGQRNIPYITMLFRHQKTTVLKWLVDLGIVNSIVCSFAIV